ncbi:unnamed protein product [Phaeothamnion confervicola]
MNTIRRHRRAPSSRTGWTYSTTFLETRSRLDTPSTTRSTGISTSSHTYRSSRARAGRPCRPSRRRNFLKVYYGGGREHRTVVAAPIRIRNRAGRVWGRCSRIWRHSRDRCVYISNFSHTGLSRRCQRWCSVAMAAFVAGNSLRQLWAAATGAAARQVVAAAMGAAARKASSGGSGGLNPEP